MHCFHLPLDLDSPRCCRPGVILMFTRLYASLLGGGGFEFNRRNAKLFREIPNPS